jgi:hypothetical protein
MGFQNKEIKMNRISIKEFGEAGYLQEVNRKFFHPLGLALEIVVDDDGSERLGGVWIIVKIQRGHISALMSKHLMN